MTMMYNRRFASIATFVVVVVAAAMNVVMQLYRWADKVMAPLGNPLTATLNAAPDSWGIPPRNPDLANHPNER